MFLSNMFFVWLMMLLGRYKVTAQGGAVSHVNTVSAN